MADAKSLEQQIKSLIELYKEQKFIKLSQFHDEFSNDDLSDEIIEKIRQKIIDKGVDILDNVPATISDISVDENADDIIENISALVADIIDSDVGKTSDTIRI